ncbi:MAG: CPBP family intramembrane glutamic endopeptidase [Planctomycetota bacterium]
MPYGAKFHGALLVFGLAYPTVLTMVYFVALADFPAFVQQAAYAGGKVFQFGFPAVYVVCLGHGKPRWSRPSAQGVAVGLGFGIVVLVAMLLLYYCWLKSSMHAQVLQPRVVRKIKDLGLDTWGKYAATGVFYALIHSLLEEYYWRWFVFGQLRGRAGVPVSIVISSLGFMAHHVVLLATFLGWNSLLAYGMAGGVGIGGAVWAWIYARSGTLLAPWLSHAVVDAAIFWIGFDLGRDAIW